MASHKTVRCITCDQLGHTAAVCPKKHTVGIPAALQQVYEAEAAGGGGGSSGSFVPGGAVDGAGGGTAAGLTRSWPMTAALGPLYLSPEQLDAAVRCRPELPAYLTCAACGLLAQNPKWCSNCSELTCAVCLDPTSHAGDQCPVCKTTGVDHFMVVPQLRYMCDVWFMAAAAAIDPVYSGGGAGGAAGGAAPASLPFPL